MQFEEDIKLLLRDIPDFPRPGILFKDITPLLGSPPACEKVVKKIAEHFSTENIHVLAAVEARGFYIRLADCTGIENSIHTDPQGREASL